MIEQKFAGVQGASFVNPYHGDSNQIYTPQDYTDVAKNIAKLASTTYKQIQDNAFRQGQIDELANAVDTDRWLGKDAYLKGAMYSKAQVDMQHLSGKVLDIVNKGVANGSSSEDILKMIREAQQSMFETAEELRDSNPEASDNLIKSLTAMQGGAIKNHAEQLIQRTYENKVHGDYAMINRMLTDQVQASWLDVKTGKPVADSNAMLGTFVGISKVLRENAISMGIDPDQYIDMQLNDGLSALFVSARMDDPNTVAFVNTALNVLDTAHASGLLSASTVQRLKTTCYSKVTEAQQYGIANATLMTGASTVYSPELENQFNNQIQSLQLQGVSPNTIAELMNAFAAKKARESNAVATVNCNPSAALPPKGATDRAAAVKATVDYGYSQFQKKASTGEVPNIPFSSNMEVASAFMQKQEWGEAKSYIKEGFDTFIGGLSISGSTFDANANYMLGVLQEGLTSTNPNVRSTFQDSIGANNASFITSYGAEFLASAKTILNGSGDADSKKKALADLGAKIHQKYVAFSQATNVQGGASVDGMGNGGGGGSGIVLSDFVNTFQIPLTTVGVGKLGISNELGAVASKLWSSMMPSTNTYMTQQGVILTKELAYDQLVNARVLNNTSDGYVYVCPTGDEASYSLLKKDDVTTVDKEAWGNALNRALGERTLSNGSKDTWSQNNVIGFFNPDTKQWIKITYDGSSGQNFDFIPDTVIEQYYYEEVKKKAQMKSDLTSNTIITSVNSGIAVDPVYGVTDAIAHADDKPTAEQTKVFEDTVKDVKERSSELTSFLDSLVIEHGMPEYKKADLSAVGDWLKENIKDPLSTFADNAVDVFNEGVTASHFIGAHIKARMYSALYSSDGTFYDRLSPEEVNAIEHFMNDDPLTPDGHERLKSCIRRYAVDAINFMGNLTTPVKANELLQVVNVSDGRGGKNPFYVTNAMAQSCFGLELGTRVMTHLAEVEGMILQARATDPRYTKDKVIGIGYKEGYPAWDKAFREAAGDAVALSRVTNNFALYYFSNVPSNFMKTTGLKWEAAIHDPHLQSTIVSLSDYLWHAGRNSKGYYHALEYVKKNDIEGAIGYLQCTAAYMQSGASRRQDLINGLYGFDRYWNKKQR